MDSDFEAGQFDDADEEEVVQPVTVIEPKLTVQKPVEKPVKAVLPTQQDPPIKPTKSVQIPQEEEYNPSEEDPATRYPTPEENRKNVMANNPQASFNELQTLLLLDDLVLKNLRDPVPSNPPQPSPSSGLKLGTDSTPQQIQEVTEQWISSLCSQFNLKNIFSSTVTLQNFTGMGIGGKLTQNIGVDDVIVSIPGVAIMSTPTLLTYSNSKHLLSRLYWDFRERVEIEGPGDMYEFTINILAIFLMVEMADPNSIYRPYLTSLPKFDTPIYWTVYEWNCLQGSALDKVLQQKQVMLYTFLEKVRPCLESTMKDEPILSEYTFTEYSWALSVLWSRSYMIKEKMQIFLVPFADMLNHREKEAEEIFDCARFEVSDSFDFKVVSHFRYSEGQQVFINYGERTNLELLVSYGFMLPKKKDQHSAKLFIPSRQLEETDMLWETKKNLIRTVLASQRYINYVECTAGQGLPQPLLQVMRVYALGVTDMVSPQQKQSILVNLLKNQRISLSNERNAVRFGLICCDYTLERFPTSLAADLSNFNSGLLEQGQPEHVANRLRIIDKKIIVAVKNNLLSYQKELNQERMKKFQERSSNPYDILTALSNLGVDDILKFSKDFTEADFAKSGSDEEERIQEVFDEESKDEEVEETVPGSGFTFIPASVRNQGLVLETSSNEESSEEDHEQPTKC